MVVIIFVMIATGKIWRTNAQMSKYDEDLKKACEILNNTELDELVQVAVEAMDDAATDIGTEAAQEWHAKITLESALIHIAEKVFKRPSLTIPKSIAEELDKVEMNWNTLKDEAQGWPTDDLIMWLDDGNNPLMFAYLAGKALGVDLVKVVEG